MSTSTPDRIVSGKGAGGAGGPSGFNSGGFPGDPEPGVFALPFRGWMALADAVSDTAPETAELMTAAAYLVQSALEEGLPELTGELSNTLADSGFSSGSVEDACSALLANRLAFTPQAVTEELVSLYADLGENHPLRRGDGLHQLTETVIEEFLDSDVAGTNARAVYDGMAAQSAQYRRPHWWASCSLDLPSVLGTAKPPLFCARPGHLFSNRLVALEWTYRGTMLTGFDGKVAGRGAVGVTTAGGGYRPTIEDLKPNLYWDTLNVPSSGLAFALTLIEGRTGKWANKVAQALDGRRTDITGAVDKQVQGARARLDTLLTAAQVPASLIHPVVGLAVTAARAVVEVISDRLVKTLRDTSLTTWGIWHTAVMGRRRVPISVFTLSLPGAGTPGLQYLRPGPDPSVEWTASDDYGADPGFLSQARFMIGASELPFGEFNDVFFDLTDGSRQPLAWRHPKKANGGFRILVPHSAPGTKASYVSSLRIDVRVEERREAYRLLFRP